MVSNAADAGSLLVAIDNQNYYTKDETNIFRQSLSAGLTDEPAVTDNGDGTITIANCVVNIFPTSNYTGILAQFPVAGGTFAVPSGTTRFIIIDYNAGAPVMDIISSQAAINESDIIPVVTVMNDDNELHWREFHNYADGAINKHNQRLIFTRGFLRQNGLSLAEIPTRVIAITGGVVWYGIQTFDVEAISSDDVTGGVKLYHWYHDGGGNWVSNDTDTTYDNTHYDSLTGLQDLGAGEYTVNWIYRLVCDDINNNEIMYVQSMEAFPTLAAAQEAGLPGLPQTIQFHCILVGRIIVKNGDPSGTVESAFDVTFAGGAISDHNSLINLQGGSGINEFYHLSANEHDRLVGGVVVQTAAYVVAVADSVVVCDSATPFAVTLPAATGTDRPITVRNVNTGYITIDVGGGGTIDGSLTQVLSQFDSMTAVDYAIGKWAII